MGEAVLLIIVAIVVVGPRDLPGLMRSLGRNISKLRRAATNLRDQSGIDEILQNENIHREVQDLQKLASGRILDIGLHDPFIPTAAALSASPPERADLYSSSRNPPRNREYPAGGPDAYGALPEDAAPYEEILAGSVAADPSAGERGADAPVADAVAADAPVVDGAGGAMATEGDAVAPAVGRAAPEGAVARGSLKDEATEAA